MEQKKLPPQEEEVDLGNLFKIIGKGISNFFNAILKFFKQIYHYLILLLIFLRKHAVKLGLALLIGFITGFILHKMQPKIYISDMIVETNYGSGMQLYKQVEYLNDLVKKKDSVSLADVLKIDVDDAAQITKIEVSAYQAKKNFYKAYDEYLQVTDTIYTKGFEFDDFKNRMAEYDLRYHLIEVSSKSKTIFSELTPALVSLVENDYYKKVKEIKINELNQKLNVLNKNLIQIDSLRKTYKEVALKEAENRSGTSTIEIAKTDNRKEENDIKLFETSDKLLYEISITNKDLIKNKDIVNVISDFDRVGVPDKHLIHKKYFQFAILFFGLMLGWILMKKINIFLEEYPK